MNRIDKIKLLKSIEEGVKSVDSLTPKPLVICLNYNNGDPNKYLFKNQPITEKEYLKMGGGTQKVRTIDIRVLYTGKQPVCSEADIID
jgi:hypothetical protein